MIASLNIADKKMMTRIFLLVVSFCIVQNSFSQNAAARYEIDAKRIGVSLTSKDALPRSREFIRLDSTYYVGWLYEGMYKFDRSSDYLGYKNAIVPLRKSFDLMNKDFARNFRQLFNDINTLIQDYPRYQDLLQLFYALQECYSNIEMPDSVVSIVSKLQAYNFKNDAGFDFCSRMAWTYHRSRFLKTNQFSHSKNSVEENEKMAFQWCYNGFSNINKYREFNDGIFGPYYSDQRTLTICYYLALLHCYNKNYDSSAYYYEKLAEGGRVSWNNYASMQAEVGNFAQSKEYYSTDLHKSYEHFLREPYYYLPQILIYGGKTKEAIKLTSDMIAQSGSTPGFGWYNIALARSYLYDGQLDSAEAALNKAAGFKELHIGTTLTQSQYDFTINLLRVQLHDKQIAEEKFLNKGWWYSPSSLYNIATWNTQKMMAEYVVVNQLSNNAERDRLVYDLFCAESTTTFDEALYLMKDFSPKYFVKKYEEYQKNDKRENIQRYFKLFTAKFNWIKGDETIAKKQFEELDRSASVDTANEKLFVASLYESLVKAYEEDDDKPKQDLYKNGLYQMYPQFIPFSGITMNVQLQTDGIDDAVTQQVMKEIKSCNINFTNTGSDAAKVKITFAKKSSAYQATIIARSSNGKMVVNNMQLIFKKPGGAGKEIALRMFGKGGAAVFEE